MSSAASTTAPSTTKFAKTAPMVFDSEGDLRFEVGEGVRKIACTVCSRSVARASPVFKTMLFGGFAESKPSEGAWVVQLPEDDINAMSILFNIIHGHVHKVPKILPKTMAELAGPSSHCSDDDAVETDVLYLITTAADKYDLIHILRPWVKYWLDRIKGKKRWAKGVWENNWCSELIWAAWILGDLDLLHSQLNKVVLSAYFWCEIANPSRSALAPVANNLRFLDSFGQFIPLSKALSGANQILEILEVRDQIAVKRLDAIEALLRPINLLRTGPRSFLAQIGVTATEDATSDEIEVVVDEITRCLYAAELTPNELRQRGRCKGSAVDVRKKLDELLWGLN
ncbi:hypothetical protein CONLIGDRAFT_644092 [Coniochaeta ligniaria NRRL 30616]|uniref:BTB domain-containing protein n=1 Tax=Coniochaeta ligniaria NRRL 30616 TaxID=1408157 RepID=A0A1J7JLA9_9PEZI|nr:hypothetical protein CONLIGDRAFT_644092 [Coniochaeta ligniaria NRRL 30616]